MHIRLRMVAAFAAAVVLPPLAAACSYEKSAGPMGPSDIAANIPLAGAPAAPARHVSPENMYEYLATFSQDNREWDACSQGNGTACFRFVWDAAKSVNPSCDRDGWGILSKAPGEWQCTREGCGGLNGEGFAEDVIAYGGWSPTGLWDVIVGAGAPGAALGFADITHTKRPGNDWACPWQQQ